MIIIGIAGGTGSGKTTVVRKIIEQLPQNEVAVISQDSYYRDNSHLPMEERKEINFDHPDSIEFSLLTKHLAELKTGQSIEEPTYSYLTCTRQKTTRTISPKSVLIVEGILVLSNASLRKMLDIKAYVDCDSDVRLSRVIQRDIIERGRNVQEVLARYEETVRPSHLQFIEPTKRFADIIIPQGGSNTVAINIFTNFIKQNL
ncbi:uridine kinase [Sunxiuqinia elliptica]|uniref:Uridine kinase n=1 Tax=Sunxiuqinia elliptica TaxID=655355 RepID=A0A4R6HC37_9BACT|nr:uridine kinase [Sunxiuqinia elliptica]TDO05336.1 uridine kinase [Sunxiuqinia elliptica]TDO64885.1 uridine kinase [Sunxiuqinia elliptica]